MFEIACVVEDAGDFLDTQSGRQGGTAFGARDRLIEPPLLQRGDIHETQRGAIEQ